MYVFGERREFILYKNYELPLASLPKAFNVSLSNFYKGGLLCDTDENVSNVSDM